MHLSPLAATMENSPDVSHEWRNVSVPIYTGMVHYPDNPPIDIVRISDVERGDICTNSRITMGSHTGTHIDAPIHFVPGGTGAEEVPLDNLIGPARVIEIKDRSAVRAEELRKHNVAGVSVCYSRLPIRSVAGRILSLLRTSLPSPKTPRLISQA